MIPCPQCQRPLSSPLKKVCLACQYDFGETFWAAVTQGQIGDYRLLSHLGSGGMGEVFVAEQLSMRRKVALKVLHPRLAENESYVKRFFYEVRMLAKVSHPNVVSAIEAGIDGQFVFFSMHLIQGRDLKWHLDHGRHFTEAETLVLLLQTADALAACWHEYHIVHRDIKPANLLLAEDQTIKIMDLGISKQYSESHAASTGLTMEGIMVGTPNYVSPEQAKALKEVTCQSDMYSLGITAYELLTGKLPYEAESVVEILALQIHGNVKNPRKVLPALSPAMAHLIMRMMQKSPSRRFKSWENFITAAEAVRTNRKRPSFLTLWTRDFLLEVTDWPKYALLTVLIAGLIISIGMTLSVMIQKQGERYNSKTVLKEIHTVLQGEYLTHPEVAGTDLKRLKKISEQAGDVEATIEADRALERIQSELLQLQAKKALSVELNFLRKAVEKYEKRAAYAEGISYLENYQQTSPFRVEPKILKYVKDTLAYFETCLETESDL